MILRSLLSLLAAGALGYSFVFALWPQREKSWQSLLHEACLGVGTGFAILSCLVFLGLSIFGSAAGTLWIGAPVVFFGLVTIGLRSRRRAPRPCVAEMQRAPAIRSKYRLILPVTFVFLLISSVITFVFLAKRFPHGDWDAWAVYNLKARFFLRGGEHWRDVFTAPQVTSPDYPLLLPAAIAGCWALAGQESTIIPIAVAMLFTFATVGLTASALAILRGTSQGLLGGLVLLGTPYFLLAGSRQYPDTPLGFFFLAALSSLVLADVFPHARRRTLLFAGVSAGMAAWTKNEGLAFIGAVLVAQVVVVLLKKGLKACLEQLLWFICGCAPMLLLIAYFRSGLSGSEPFFELQGQTTVQRLMDGSRYLVVLKAFTNELSEMGNWVVSIALILAIYLLLVGINLEWLKNLNSVTVMLAIIIMGAIYFFVFVITPLDLSWHLATTSNRLSFQFLPGLVFIFYLIARTPQEAMAPREPSTL